MRTPHELARDLWRYTKDASGHEHAPAGSPEGGQFTGKAEHGQSPDDMANKLAPGETTPTIELPAGRELIDDFVAKSNAVWAKSAAAHERRNNAKTREESRAAFDEMTNLEKQHQQMKQDFYESLPGPAIKAPSRLNEGIEIKAASSTTDPEQPKFAWKTREGAYSGTFKSEDEIRDQFGGFIPGYDSPEVEKQWKADNALIESELQDSFPDDQKEQADVLRNYGGGNRVWHALTTPEIVGKEGILFRQINDKWALRVDPYYGKFAVIPASKIKPAKASKKDTMRTPDELARDLHTQYAAGGKVEKTMGEFKRRKLHSGSKKGPLVTDPKQAIAIALEQARTAGEQ